jgi:hypothetical protein
MSGYIYSPFWIYTVGALGSTPAWLPGLVLFLFNMSTGLVVFLISKELTDNDKRSIFSMLLFLLNPFTVLYGSYLWLNPTPFVFFVILSFYLALKRQAYLSVTSMALAVLYKQFAVLFFPLLLLLLIKDNDNVRTRKSLIDFIRYSVVYCGIVLIGSLPFLIVNAEAYIERVLIVGYPPSLLMTFNPSTGWPISFNTFFLWIGIPSLITDVIAYLLAYYIPLAISGLLIFVAFARFQVDSTSEEDRVKKLVKLVIFWSIILVMAFQLYYPRGAYKYYLLMLVPFISILFDYQNLGLESTESFTFKKSHLYPIVISLVVVVCFRLVYFWILVIWILFYLRKSGRWVSKH